MTQNVARISEFYVIKMHVSAGGLGVRVAMKVYGLLTTTYGALQQLHYTLILFPRNKIL